MDNFAEFRCFRCGQTGHLKAECTQPKQRSRFGWSRAPEEPPTYLAEIEDSEGHPMALRVPVGVTPHVRPPCKHRHSLLCEHNQPITPDN